MFTILIISLLSLVYFVYYFLTRNHDYWKKRNVTGPEPSLLVGNVKDFFLRRRTQAEINTDIYRQYPNEKVVGIHRLTTPVLLVRDLDVIKSIVIKDFDNFVDRGVEFDTDGLGANLFNADGDRWNVLRNKFTPLFTSGKLKNMFYLMNERGDLFIDYMKKVCPEKSDHDIYPLIQKYTISTIAACAFGIDIGIKDEDDFIKELHDINTIIFTLNRAVDFDIMFPGVFKVLSASLLPKKVKTFFTDLTRSVIKQRNGKPTNRKDFMDLILELREQKQISGMKRGLDELVNLEITEGLITAQAFVFYAAGFETSATTMAFMLYELSKNPDIQDKVIEEIDSVLKTTNGEVTYDCLTEMTYLTKVFDETLRKYPIVDPLQRVAKANYKIPESDIEIEKGTMVLISPFAIHYDEKYYKNPEKFDPERFSPENSGDRHPCAYMPFGLGPRNCIGMRFAKVQSRVCIVKLLSNFKVQPSKDSKQNIKFNPYYPIINPLGGVPLTLVPRVK